MNSNNQPDNRIEIDDERTQQRLAYIFTCTRARISEL